jgi:hypothetical protein
MCFGSLAVYNDPLLFDSIGHEYSDARVPLSSITDMIVEASLTRGMSTIVFRVGKQSFTFSSLRDATSINGLIMFFQQVFLECRSQPFTCFWSSSHSDTRSPLASCHLVHHALPRFTIRKTGDQQKQHWVAMRVSNSTVALNEIAEHTAENQVHRHCGAISKRELIEAFAVRSQVSTTSWRVVITLPSAPIGKGGGDCDCYQRVSK